MKRLMEIIIAGVAVFGTVIGASAQLATYNLSADYSTNQNPSGVWAHGYLTNITSKFVQFSNLQRVDYGNGAAEMRWNRVADSLPEVVKFYFNTGTSDGGQGVYPPGTVLIFGGFANTSADYGAIRFTAPTGGVYSVTVGVTNYLNGASSGDTDFHIRINGGAFLSNALPATVATSYTFTTNLSAGGTIDFASGRGADNNLSGSGLKIGAIISANAAASPSYQLSQQFPIATNPSNRWTLGYKSTTNGGFVPYGERYSAADGNSFFLGWMRVQGSESLVRQNTGPSPYSVQAVIPVGGVTLNPGPSGNPDNYAVARFVVPSNSNYRVTAWASPSFPSGQGDTDFHVIVNGVLVKGAFLAGSARFGYTNEVALSTGDTVEIALGRGADNSNFASYLNSDLLIEPVAAPQPPVNPDIAFFPNGGLYTNSVSVTLSNALGFGQVRYTIDGSSPSATSLLYAGPINLTTNATIRAQAYFNGFDISSVYSQTYLKLYAVDDGVPNAWRFQFFGAGYLSDPRVGAGQDPDNDGRTNIEEYQAGTNPLDPLSGFALSIRTVPQVIFSSVPGRTYRIGRSEGVTNIPVTVTNILATATVTRFTDAGITNSTSFYTVTPLP